MSLTATFIAGACVIIAQLKFVYLFVYFYIIKCVTLLTYIFYGLFFWPSTCCRHSLPSIISYKIYFQFSSNLSYAKIFHVVCFLRDFCLKVFIFKPPHTCLYVRSISFFLNFANSKNFEAPHCSVPPFSCPPSLSLSLSLSRVKIVSSSLKHSGTICFLQM